ncbi:sulfatase-like hydrolase/transferase [Salinirubellus salinus]|uniref:Sulfatase-like hydrolase/transferase n=1 Tax=Salinirubellus salinus TaxID=1364945 RepID=A0A9E7QZ79_9EURY|nr:sulfatase-like hydrolase/transferase [Salinirubellus salinus]UWM52751.1 sulfatase-like hydrolase/transferase [Salinirubellus salinus]
MNLLYVTVDALRQDHVVEEIMPATREFFDEAVEFKECVANGPGTPWSFPALLAGRYSGGTVGFGIPDTGDSRPTLAEVISDHGWSTAGFTDNRFASSAYHYDRGFDTMNDEGAVSFLKELKQIVRERFDRDGLVFQSLLRAYHLLDGAVISASGRDSRFVRAKVLVDQLINWTADEDDWFAWFHPMDVHDPYEAPPEYQRMFLDSPVDRIRSQKLARAAVHHPEELSDEEWDLQRRLYRAECRYFDDQYGRLLSALEQRGELEETIIVFTSDHGDMHGEHGRGGHPQEFWEEVIRVPLAIRVPGYGHSTLDGQTALVDVPPTILELLEIAPPDGWDGESIWDRVEGGSQPRQHAFIDVGAELDRQHAGIRRADGWKLMRHRESELLFDLSENPTEREEKNHRDVAKRPFDELTDALDAHLDEMERRRSGDASGVQDEEMIEDHLRELGYLE